LIIELRRAHTPEDIDCVERCAICGEEFRTAVVLGIALSDAWAEIGEICPACIGVFGAYKPEKFPTLEEYTAALEHFPEPIWVSLEEADRAWQEGEPWWAAVKASIISR
jgi:hypothetical protein